MSIRLPQCLVSCKMDVSDTSRSRCKGRRVSRHSVSQVLPVFLCHRALLRDRALEATSDRSHRAGPLTMKMKDRAPVRGEPVCRTQRPAPVQQPGGSPSDHFEHVEHGAEQRQGEAARRDPQARDLNSGRLAAAFFVHLRPLAPSTGLTIVGAGADTSSSRKEPRPRHTQPVHRRRRTGSGTCEEVPFCYPLEIAGVSVRAFRFRS